MTDWSFLTQILLEFLVLLAAGLAGCWAARHMGLRPLVGGVLAGVLLGPATLGQWAPETYQQIFTGAVAQREELRDYLVKRQTDRLTLESTGVTPVAFEEFDRQTDRHAAALRLQLESAQQQHDQRVVLALGLPVVVLAFATAVLRSGITGHRSSLPGVVGAAVGGAAAGALAGWIVGRIEHIDPGPGTWQIIGGLAIGCGVPAFGPAESKLSHDRERLWRYLGEPLLYALVGATLPLDTGFFPWTVLLALLAFGDGRVLGAAGAARLGGGRGWAVLRSAARRAAGSPLPLAGAYLMFALDFISAELLVALVLANLITAALEPLLEMKH